MTDQTKPNRADPRQMHARAFNAVGPALGTCGEWLRLTSRRAVAEAVLAALKPELDALAEYESTINWHTTCTSCARVLDSCIRETERAERAEAAVARVRAAVHIADDEDRTDWQRGFRACSVVALGALDEPAPGPAATEATERETTTRVFAALHRSAEQDVSRVIALYEQTGCRCHNGDELCSGCRRCPDVCDGCDGPEYQAADKPKEQP